MWSERSGSSAEGGRRLRSQRTTGDVHRLAAWKPGVPPDHRRALFGSFPNPMKGKAIRRLVFAGCGTSECLNKKNTFCVGLTVGSWKVILKFVCRYKKGKKKETQSLSRPLLQYFKSCWLNSGLHESGEIPFSLLQYLLQWKKKKSHSQFFQYQAAFPGPLGPHLE